MRSMWTCKLPAWLQFGVVFSLIVTPLLLYSRMRERIDDCAWHIALTHDYFAAILLAIIYLGFRILFALEVFKIADSTATQIGIALALTVLAGLLIPARQKVRESAGYRIELRSLNAAKQIT